MFFDQTYSSLLNWSEIQFAVSDVLSFFPFSSHVTFENWLLFSPHMFQQNWLLQLFGVWLILLWLLFTNHLWWSDDFSQYWWMKHERWPNSALMMAQLSTDETWVMTQLSTDDEHHSDAKTQVKSLERT